MTDELKGEMPEIKAEETQAVSETDTKDDVKVEGKNIIVNGEVYEPERALELIKKLRQSEKDLPKVQKQLNTLMQEKEERKKAELSEIDRLKLEKQEAEAKLAQLTLNQTRREIAEKVKLPFALADRIKGDTPEEMEADAKQLFEALPHGVAPKTGVTNPGAQASEGAPHREPRIDPFDKGFIESHGGGVILK